MNLLRCLLGFLASALALSAQTQVGRISNLSVLARLTIGASDFRIGVVVRGPNVGVAKPVLIRAVGPSLSLFGLSPGDLVADPRIDVFAGQALNAPIVASNEDWGGAEAIATATARVGAFPFADAASRDAAVALDLPAADYVIQVSGPGRRLNGLVLAELYDATPAANMTAATPRLINVSVLYQIQTAGEITAGFVIAGGPRTVLIRAIGPGLAPFAVILPMADPQLTLFRGQEAIGANDNWSGDAQVAAAGSAVGAFPIANGGSRDAMLLAALQPGDYSARVRGVGGSTGNVLLEVYEVP